MRRSAQVKLNLVMKVYAIWIQHDGEIWLHAAWDKCTAEDHNPEGYRDAVESARSEYGTDYVRTQMINIPTHSVEELFNIPEVNAGPDRNAEAIEIIEKFVPGQKIAAIKAIREQYGFDLREAKYFVDYYMEKGIVVFPGSEEFDSYSKPF